ncbi:MAG TPA: hypothetical protein PLW65_24860, partial [Pseudomonadota bacterium]|nr:hypothetical protein [Pseudomonadota bacterium]
MSRRVRVTLGALLCICGSRGAGQGAAAAGGRAGAPASASASEALSFISERSGNRDVYLIAADGNSEQALTRSAAHESNLALTPDGRYLLLAAAQGGAERDRRFRFALAPLAPGLPRQPLGALPPALFPARAVLLNPSFAPDGKSLYFESESSGLRDLFQLPLTPSYRAAGEPRQLTRNPEGNFAPSVCARGDFLAFTSSRDRVSELYRMRRDGSDLRRLTYSAGSEWQPRCHP